MAASKGRNKGMNQQDAQIMELIEKMGRMMEALERGREDRSEMKESFSKFDDSIQGLHQAVNALTQSINATSNQVASISMDKCGERLTRIESTLEIDTFAARLKEFEDMKRTVANWKGLIGEGWALMGRVFLAVLTSGLAGGAIISLIRDHIH